MKTIRNTLLTAFVLFGCSATHALAAKSPVAIPTVVPFADASEVGEAIKAECQLGEKLSQFTASYGKKGVTVSDTPLSGLHLDMAITHVYAPAGGAFSGPKWMEVKGTLKDGDNAIASFRGKRFSGGGAFGAMKGTCAIIGRTTKALGKDIAKWLKDPQDGAALGDAR